MQGEEETTASHPEAGDVVDPARDAAGIEDVEQVFPDGQAVRERTAGLDPLDRYRALGRQGKTVMVLSPELTA